MRDGISQPWRSGQDDIQKWLLGVNESSLEEVKGSPVTIIHSGGHWTSGERTTDWNAGLVDNVDEASEEDECKTDSTISTVHGLEWN